MGIESSEDESQEENRESSQDRLEAETSLLSPVKRQRLRRHLLSNSVSELTFRSPFSPNIRSTVSAPLVNADNDGDASIKRKGAVAKGRAHSIATFLCMGDPGAADDDDSDVHNDRYEVISLEYSRNDVYETIGKEAFVKSVENFATLESFHFVDIDQE